MGPGNTEPPTRGKIQRHVSWLLIKAQHYCSSRLSLSNLVAQAVLTALGLRNDRYIAIPPLAASSLQGVALQAVLMFQAGRKLHPVPGVALQFVAGEG